MKLISAVLQAGDKVVLTFDGNPGLLSPKDFRFEPDLPIHSVEGLETLVVLKTEAPAPDASYAVSVCDFGSVPLIPDGILNEFVSAKPLGCNLENDVLVFRLFAPRASAVTLYLHRDLDDESGTPSAMERDADGVWEARMPADRSCRYYSYAVDGPRGDGELFDPSVRIADPYSRAVTTRNTYLHEGRSHIPAESPLFDWGDDEPVRIHPRDLVIYEAHVRDATAHGSSGVEPALAGTYLGLATRGSRGGIDHLLSLGVNAVELMPCQHFASMELPYRRAAGGMFNTWNPYERNHWGYMTSYFFTPEPTYATGASFLPGVWNDTGGRQVDEFKRMVKELHSAGIAVLLDVVYNHTSQYDRQPLKYIDRYYYYRSDERGNWTNSSGCGNDFHSARPMSRRLIIDSLLHWMKEYHVDGFRFDLAALLDQDTVVEIIRRAREVNTDVILIGEAWGGGRYDLKRFSELGMGSWNDVFRNGVKGSHPVHDRGYIFGNWGWNPPESFGKWVTGSTERFGGPFLDAAHSVNYLAAHDGYTLGDFIRIAIGDAREHRPVRGIARNAALKGQGLKRARLAAFMLMVSQGTVMLEHGQEYGRSKVIARRRLPDAPFGTLDHNSYEKDDETNWINYEHLDATAELADYYRGLIAIRGMFPALRRASPDCYEFLKPDAPVAGGFILRGSDKGDDAVAALINPNDRQAARFGIPDGVWRVMADDERASASPIATVSGGEIALPPISAMFLCRDASADGDVYFDTDTAR